MTIGCSHKDSGRRRSIPFLYNPFEIAVCGSSPDDRFMLLAMLTAHFEASYTLGQVMQREPQMAPDTTERMGVTLIQGDGQHGLMYPESSDAFLGPRPLLDVDLVLVETAEDLPMPKLVLVEDGVPATDCSNVLACVGRSSACPVLPSSAEYYTLSQGDTIAARVEAHLQDRVNATPLYGLVLAGGRSTRMGTDKASLEYHGKTQVAHCHDLLRDYCDDVFVSARADQADSPAQAGFTPIYDAFLEFGPMGGILSALRAHPDAAWLVLACDLPYVTPETLADLVESRNPFKLATAYVSDHDGLPEPLCAIYEPKSIHRMLAFLARGYHCPRKVLINSDTHLLEPRDPRALDNVNHPHEYEAAREALNAHQEQTS